MKDEFRSKNFEGSGRIQKVVYTLKWLIGVWNLGERLEMITVAWS